MTIKDLKDTIKTYKDWELEEMRKIIGNEELTKQHLISVEMHRRRKERENGTYTDETLDPKVPIRRRLRK